MGSFDCYCAICAGPLGGEVRFGSRGAKALAKRRRHVDRVRRRNGGEEVESSDEDDDADPENDDPDAEENIEDSDEEEEVDEYDEQYSYDPDVLKEENTAWTEICRCLGFNQNAPGISKAFISGRGRYTDYGSFDVYEPGNDPNDTNDAYTCYETYDSEEPPVYPFHERCYELLARCIFGKPAVKDLDKDLMYSVMSQFFHDDGLRTLEFDYGHSNVGEQFWTSVSGDEWTVFDPQGNPELQKTIRDMIMAANIETPQRTLSLDEKVRFDPFAKLPYDLIYMLFPFLSKKATFNLMEASWPVLASTRNAAFWKQLIRLEILPWFWELVPILNDGLSDTIDYKGLYFWLDKVTEGSPGMEGPLLGIANRKRIWRVCDQIAEVYREKVSRKRSQHQDDDQDDEEAEAILAASSSPYMAHVSLPTSSGGQPISKQFIRSWDEIDDRSSVFETFWDEDGALVGLAVIFGSNRRTFGTVEDEEHGLESASAHIPANEWIREVVLNITPVDVFKEMKQNAFVAAITLVLTSGDQRDLVGPNGNRQLRRGLVVSPNMHLTGFVGQIGKDGTISRLGLLQAPHPSNADLSTPPIPQTQKLLWGPSSAYLPSTSQGTRSLSPIWNHPHISMLPISGSFSSYIPNDMMPHHVLLWAAEEEDLRRKFLIGANVVVGGTASVGGAPGGGFRERPIHDILAFRVDFLDNGGTAPFNTRIGFEPFIRAEDGTLTENQEFDEKAWSNISVDGGKGELVSEVHVARDGKAVILKTNKGKEVYWGELERDRWEVLKAPEGEVIVGLVAAFGQKSGWDWGTKTNSHLKAAAMTALTMRVEGLKIEEGGGDGCMIV